MSTLISELQSNISFFKKKIPVLLMIYEKKEPVDLNKILELNNDYTVEKVESNKIAESIIFEYVISIQKEKVYLFFDCVDNNISISKLSSWNKYEYDKKIAKNNQRNKELALVDKPRYGR